jgi:sulfatase maturation enzyme AslB (radical SAM superfamily)
VSIDGDSTINFHTGSGNPSSVTDSVVRRFQQLQASGVNCGVLSVITNSHKDRAKEFYNFCVQNRLNNIGLCKCLNEENGMTVRNDVLTAFLIDLFDLYFHGDYPLNIREFGTAIGKLLGRNDGVCTMVGRRNCGSYLTFDVHGNVFYCDTSYDLNQTIGNIEESSLDEVLCTKAYQERQSECASWY